MALQPAGMTGKQKDLALAFVAFVVALLLWQVQGLYVLTFPLRLFVTLIHELSHGAAAVLTGGAFVRFEVSERGAGLAYTSGGSRFWIIQAGYLGTALFGAVLLILANRLRNPGPVAAVLGLLIGVLTVLYSGLSVAGVTRLEAAAVAGLIILAVYLILTREKDQGRILGIGLALLGALLLVTFAGWSEILLTVVVGLGSAFLLLVIGWRAGRTAVLVILDFLAFLTGLQAITDAWSLLRIASLPHSMMPLNDASSMAQAYGGSATLWALSWIVLDILIFGAAVYWALIRRGARR